jgi:uncharacterized YccA/Bax inhibitor family protein
MGFCINNAKSFEIDKLCIFRRKESTLMKSSNPVFTKRFASLAGSASGQGSMTISGTLDKTAILFFLVFISASYTWDHYLDQSVNVSGLMLFGLFGGFIAALVTSFKPVWAPVTAPVYALLEGLFLGGLSVVLNYAYPGLPLQAVGLTFTVLLVMLVLYRLRIIRVTEKLRSGIMAATMGVLLFYMLGWILSFFGSGIGFMVNSSPLGIGFSLLVVGIAAFNLLLDFDFIERAVAQGYPAYMNWMGAFGLMVTLVWLYVEILRLLTRLRD